MRVTLDTNLIVSGLMLPNSVPGHLLEHWDRHGYILVTSSQQLSELQRVLSYPKIKKFIPKARAGRFINRLYSKALFVVPERVPPIIEDEEDLLILGTAVAGKAHLLVSGDHELLALGKYRGVRIVPPAHALKQMGGR